MSKREVDEDYQNYLKWLKLKVNRLRDELLKELKQEREDLVEQMKDRGFTDEEIFRVIYKDDLEPMYERGFMQRPH